MSGIFSISEYCYVSVHGANAVITPNTVKLFVSDSVLQSAEVLFLLIIAALMIISWFLDGLDWNNYFA